MPINTYGSMPSRLSPSNVLIWGRKLRRKKRGEAKTENKRVQQQKHEKNGGGGGDLQRRATCCVMSIEIEKKKGSKHKEKMLGNKIRGGHDLLKMSRVHSICHIYYQHIYLCLNDVTINGSVEAKASFNPFSIR